MDFLRRFGKADLQLRNLLPNPTICLFSFEKIQRRMKVCIKIGFFKVFLI
jgi:hypothetical protein